MLRDHSQAEAAAPTHGGAGGRAHDRNGGAARGGGAGGGLNGLDRAVEHEGDAQRGAAAARGELR